VKQIVGGEQPLDVNPRRAERPDEGGPSADLTVVASAAVMPIANGKMHDPQAARGSSCD
jgi:hypothetical protein